MNNENKRNPYMFIENVIGSPCKNCKKRKLGCHSKCEEYQEYKKLTEENKRRIAK